MNEKLSEMVFILDRSGSMQPLAGAAVEAFNGFLRDQREIPGMGRMTLIQFDDEYEVWAQSVPVAEVVELTEETYQPRGSTALLDAVGRTIDELGSRLAAMAEADRPASVIVAIMTDGAENSSRQYSLADVSARIRHQTDVYGWQFLFLGANQDAIATAAAFQISSRNASSWAGDRTGVRASTAVLSRKMSAMRKMKTGDATPDDALVAEQSLTEMVETEDAKRRGKKSPGATATKGKPGK